jgi:hypothetical protein
VPEASADTGVEPASDALPPDASLEGGPSDGAAPPTTETGTSGFAGTYTCTATTDVEITSPISDSFNENLSGTLTVAQTGSVAKTTLSITSGGVTTTCTLTAAVSGTTATISPANQTCAATITSPVTIDVTMTFLSGGTSSLSGSTLTSSLPYTATGTFEGQPADGHGTLSANCTK